MYNIIIPDFKELLNKGCVVFEESGVVYDIGSIVGIDTSKAPEYYSLAILDEGDKYIIPLRYSDICKLKNWEYAHIQGENMLVEMNGKIPTYIRLASDKTDELEEVMDHFRFHREDTNFDVCLCTFSDALRELNK